ncbi:MAG TPA: S8 family serine peptidase [Gemmatimonadales bacterium]|nr:S8 family serine peptidase [Gemmatimonadales bacterium]
MKRRLILSIAAALVLGACSEQEPITGNSNPGTALAVSGTKGINVVLKGPATSAQLTELGNYGTVKKQLVEINALTMLGKESSLPAIRALPFVAAANFDAERNIPPDVSIPVNDFTTIGISTWDLDAVNVTNRQVGTDRTITQDGSGVYVAILDTGLLPTWRYYFPADRIKAQYAKSFGGGGNDAGNVSEQPNKWEHDSHSHGTHVTSTVIGYLLNGTPVNGVAPKASIIPVKVLNQNGSGWSSVIAEGITYIGDLKAGPLAGSPVVINMSLGGPNLDAVEQAAINYAIAQGVIIVASAGNSGAAGMGFPGEYEPVISAAASGWVGEWKGCANTLFGLPGQPATIPAASWWNACDVAEPTAAGDFYITDFSSRELAGQDLDVAAPGSWVVGPFQLQQGQLSYFFLGGTSMASPHVAGIAALMAQKNNSLTGPQAETILEGSAIPLPAGSRTITNPDGSTTVMTWGTDATGAGLATADAAVAATP